MGWLSLLALSGALALCGGYLLPGDVAPTHYDLRLLYDVDPATEFSFYGVVDILIKPQNSTSKIVLHAQKFNISNDKIKLTSSPENNPVRITRVDLNDTYNFLTLDLNDTLRVDKDYYLAIPFYGNLETRGLNGVFISHYFDKKTRKTEYLIATLFEPISARKGFPCFDEPLYKATFTITIGHHKDFSAVSNMPLSTTTADNVFQSYWPWSKVQETFKKSSLDFVWDKFIRSERMSTYLVAFVVSKLSYVDCPLDLSKVRFRIWARKDALDQTSFSSIIAPTQFSNLEKWLKVTLSLTKVDIIAIPDFDRGGMENCGLILMRESELLFDVNETPYDSKEIILKSISHELMHQWFGNLVTMKWWSELWLKEGFATFVESLYEEFTQTWTLWPHKTAEIIFNLLEIDALESSHPMSVLLDDPNRIMEIYDEISYTKGAVIIRMISLFIGEDVFQTAINNYLLKYKYSNAEQNDLWRELTTSVVEMKGGLSRNVSVKEIMDTWTMQPGFPLLTVTRDYIDNTATITQERYLSSGDTANKSSWWVPLYVLCQGDNVQSDLPHRKQWLASDEGVNNGHQVQHEAESTQWLLFNLDYVAPYRVNYDARNWQLLISALHAHGGSSSSIPRLSRVQLISDAFALAWSNRLDYTTAIKLASYLDKEEDYLPLDTGLKELFKIEEVLKRTPDYGAFQRFARKLIADKYSRTGLLVPVRSFSGEVDATKMETKLSSWACRMNMPGCEQKAIEMFQQWMDTTNPDKNNAIPLEFRELVYCVAISRGTVAQWRFLLERRRRANLATAQRMMRDALACTKDVWLLAEYLEWTVTEGSDIRRQDAQPIIEAVARSAVGYHVAKRFVYDRIKDIYETLYHQGRMIGKVLSAILEQFTSQRELDEFVVWRNKNMQYLEGSKLTIKLAIDKAKVNIGWLQKNRKHVVEKFKQFSADNSEIQFRSRNNKDNTRNKSARTVLDTNTFWMILLYLRLRFISNSISNIFFLN